MTNYKSLKNRLSKISSVKTKSNDIVIFIDDVAMYKGVRYTKDEFYLEFPRFSDDKVIDII